MNPALQELLNKATIEELAEVKEFVGKQTKAAKEARFDELTQQFMDVISAIRKEFPDAVILCGEMNHYGEDVDILCGLHDDYDEYDFLMNE